MPLGSASRGGLTRTPPLLGPHAVDSDRSGGPEPATGLHSRGWVSARLAPRPQLVGTAASVGQRLLENGTVMHKSQCGHHASGSGPSRAGARCGHVQTSIPVGTTFGCLPSQLPEGVSSRNGSSSTHRSTSRSFPSGSARVDDLDGEFDPGSGRTLAARLTHASRT